MKSKPMKSKPIMPYARLLAHTKELVQAVKYPHRCVMWVYPKSRLDKGRALGDLMQRVLVADQLGYDVLLRNVDDGLCVKYVKRIDVPLDMA